jgi:ParB-like chromosome segregation protein Spo0J
VTAEQIVEYLQGQHPTTALQRAMLRRIWAVALAVDEYEMTYAEVADLLGVTRQRANQMAIKARALPRPIRAGLKAEFEVWCAAPPDERAEALDDGHLETEPPRPRKARQR